MIKEIKLTNFYGFREETITLQPDVNMLIGINGSGKSNLFRAIRLLKDGIAGKGLRAHIFEDLGGFDNIFFKGSQSGERTITLQFTLDVAVLNAFSRGYPVETDITYTIEFARLGSSQDYTLQERVSSVDRRGVELKSFLNRTATTGELLHEAKTGLTTVSKLNQIEVEWQELALRDVSDSRQYPVANAVKQAIREISVYDYFDTTPTSAIRRATMATGDKVLHRNGGNLGQILNSLKINSKSHFSKIVEHLHEVNSHFRGFDFNFISGNVGIELMLDEQGLESAVHVSCISDGTLRYLCLLAILLNPERGKLICIDEPEVGLHPDMIRNIANAIKQAAKESTLLIATHSDHLLNCFDLEQVRVFEKDDTNNTKVTTYKEEQFKNWYETFLPGDMWNAGDLGGVRYGG
jgi:predicted ATPase